MERSIAMARTTSHAGERATYREYASWPEDGKRYEILDGEVVEMSAPLIAHQDVVLAVGLSLRAWFVDRGGGRAWIAPVDVILADDTVVQPDVMAVRAERLEIVRAEGIFGAPDLVVEVLSPSTSSRDMLEKRRIYERHGVREYWIVDPVTNVVWQFALEDGAPKHIGGFAADVGIESRSFPGLTVKLTTIWPLAQPK